MDESKGMQLINKGKKGIFRLVFSRMGLMFLMMLIQLGLLFGIFFWFEGVLNYLLAGNVLFSFITVTYLLNSRMDNSVKITWLIVIMLLPIFGCMLLGYTQSEVGHRALKKRLNDIYALTGQSITQKIEDKEAVKEKNVGVAALSNYINKSGCFPIYRNKKAVYFPTGEDKWAEMLKQIEKAKEYIFLEYFIIDEGVMWGKILELLAKKAKEGVEIRLMYDGTCEFALLPHDYPERLRKLGIACKMFSPVTPFLSTHYNYRDHRKILVIDGTVGFTGGVNLADEYINKRERFGHWKDTAVMLEGEAVQSLTLMFLQMWSIDEREIVIDKYLKKDKHSAENKTDNGFVLPFGDNPMDHYKVGERVYIDILNRAERYIYIMTPYLILDGEMEGALKYAAERGVDVKLILPGIPDKKAPYALAKTHYASLIESGVQIYEYTPGFVHAKVFVSDDREAVVGTINLDYRSLYHHFECGVYLYETDCIDEIVKDFHEMFPSCMQVTQQTIRKEKIGRKILGVISKAVAPLM